MNWKRCTKTVVAQVNNNPEFAWTTEKSHEKSQSGYPVSGPRFEPWTSRIRKSVNHSTTTFGAAVAKVLLNFLHGYSKYLHISGQYYPKWWAGWLSQYSVWIRDGRPNDPSSIPGRGERTFPLASVFRPALGPTQPPVQWVLEVISPGVKRGRGVTLTTHSILVPRSKMSRSYTYSPPRRLRVLYWDSFSFFYYPKWRAV
jgi:hypothetical protein